MEPQAHVSLANRTARGVVRILIAGASGLRNAVASGRSPTALARERELERVNRMFRTLSEINQAIVRCQGRAELFDAVCRSLVEAGRFQTAWIGLIHPATSSLDPVAVAGDERGYVSRIHISANGTEPEGGGPSGRALREGSTQVCNEFESDPRMAPWREDAALSGIVSSIALPLRQEDRLVGVLTVYSAERGSFDPERTALLEKAADDISFSLGVFGRDERRREAEAALMNSESRLSFFLSATPVVIYSLRAFPEKGAAFISPNVRQVLGHDPASFTGDPGFWEANIHPDDRAGAQPPDTELRRAGRLLREYRFRHHDGGYRWMRDDLRAVHDAAGRLTGYVGYWLDITESRTLAEDLAHEQARFRFVFANAPVGISLSAKDRILMVNPEHERITGVSAAESGEPGIFKRFTHPEDLERQLRTAGGYARGEVAEYSVDKRYLRRDGTVVWVQLTSRFYLDPTTGEKESVTTLVDITERRKAEEALAARELLLSSIFSQANDSIALIDVATGRCIEFNDAACRGLGYSREEFGKLGISDVDPAYSVGEVSRKFDLINRPGGSVIETRHRTKSGEFRDVRLSACGLTIGGRRYLAAIWSDITERLRREQEFRKLWRAIEQSPMSIVITTLAGEIEYVNPWFTEVTGYAFDEVKGQNPRILKGSESPPGYFQEMWGRLKAGKVWRGELHNRRKNGELFVELAVIAPVIGPDGRATNYVAIKEDITERIRAETAVHASERRYRELFDLDSDALFLIEQHGGMIRQANRAAADLYGYTAGELLTLRIEDLAEETETAMELRGTGRSQATGRMQRVHRKRDGSTFLVEIGLRLFERDGTVFLLAAIRDVSEREKAAREIQRLLEEVQRFNSKLEASVRERTAELGTRNSELQGLLNAIPDMVMQIHTDGSVLKCQVAQGSPGLGALARAGDGGGPTTIADGLINPCLELGRRSLDANSVLGIETQLEQGNGSIFVELRAAPVGPEVFIVFIRDITERQRREAETATMLEKEHQISEMKTRFISVTSHEFRTPMAAVMGSADLLENHIEQITPAKRAELFGRIKGSLGRMTEMLDEVLTLNRIDSGKTAARIIPVDLRQAVQGVIDEIQTGDGGVHRFALEAEGDLGAIPTDANLIHHILSNLLSNGARYSPAGTEVTVRLRAEGSRVVIAVEDQGIGIPPADLARIFEAFERASNVGTVKGTGLGLNIVRRMTELLGGRVGVDSTLNKGSLFTVELPIPPPRKP